MPLPDPADLGLSAHPEGGFYRELHRSGDQVQRGDGSLRSALTAIHFLLLPGGISRWHRVRGGDEWWQVIDGGPLHLWLGPDPATTTRLTLSPGASGHALVPSGWWQAAEAPAGALCLCLVAPGFDFADFDLISDHGRAAVANDPERSRFA